MSLFASMNVSASGMAAQRTRAELLVQNIANSETTRTPEGGPYKRQDTVFSSEPQTSPFSAVFQNELADGVTVSDILVDQSAPDMRYMPGHPDANADGYVAFPKINPAEDMVDLLSATRSYEANVAAIASVKDMISRSIDIMRS
jgi:flagellar basal-body rod protein FlgC